MSTTFCPDGMPIAPYGDPGAPCAIPLDEAERQLADLAVRLHLLAGNETARVTALPRAAGDPPGARFLAAGLLTREQIDRLMETLHFKDKRVVDSRFGTLAIERGFVDPDQMAAALAEQKRLFLQEGRTVLLGTLLVEKGLLTREQCDGLLAEQGRLRAAAMAAPGAPDLRLVIAEDRMRATLMVNEATLPTVKQLLGLLAEHGVVHGIDGYHLAAIAAGDIAPGRAVVVARGTPVVEPHDGSVEWLGHGDRVRDTPGLRNGSVLPAVSAGTPIARTVPPVPGRAGMDVFGRPIPPPAANDGPLCLGKGVALDGDGVTVRATVEGHPVRSATGVVSVYAERFIDGDVDHGTGHIDFPGRVVVAGTVRSGFRVRCGELVAQEIETAEVESEGDVTVSGGIIGARIHGGGALSARYIHRARVQMLGDIVVGREVIDSSLQAGGAFHGRRCIVLSSRISATGGVEAQEIGSESSHPCRIVAGVDERAQQEISHRQQQLESLAAACAASERRIAEARSRREAIGLEIGRLAQEQDRALVRQRTLQGVGGGAAKEESDRLAGVVRIVEARLEALFAEQDRLEAKVRSDADGLRMVREELEFRQANLVHLNRWAAARTGEFLVRARRIHQQTDLKGPHVEVRLTADIKGASLVEREWRDNDGHCGWHIVKRRA